MIKTIIKAIYFIFISIVIISIALAGWTCFSFISQPKKSGEIINVIQEMYKSQKTVIIDVFELSKILIKDKDEIIASQNTNLLSESELLTTEEDKSLLNQSSILEDNGDNPLGIVFETPLPEVSSENIPEISLGALSNDENEVSMNEMEIGMDMN